MADADKRLSLHDVLTLFESAIRLVGGANATGALASGVSQVMALREQRGSATFRPQLRVLRTRKKTVS